MEGQKVAVLGTQHESHQDGNMPESWFVPQLHEQKGGIEDEREDCVASLHNGHTSSGAMDSSLVCAFQGAGQNDLVREGSAHSAQRVD